MNHTNLANLMKLPLVAVWNRKRFFGLLSLFLLFTFMLMFQPQSSRAQQSGSEKESGLLRNDKLLDISLSDSGQGWIVGHNGRIFHTGDFGKTWVAQTSGTRKSLFSVSFVDTQNGWIVGELGTILHTEDGGATWVAQSSGIAVEHLLMVYFLNKQRGWASGTFGTLLTTADGGNVWEPLAFKRIKRNDLHINDIYFIDDQNGWAAAEFEMIGHTSDGGKSWAFQTEKGFRNLFGLSFRDKDHGVAVGTEGMIIYTEDGGNTWKPATNNQKSKKTLMKVDFFDNTKGIAVGLDGAVLATSDGGATWDPIPSAVYFNWFSCIALTEDGHGLIAGSGGTIARTEDYGKMWH